VVSGRWREGEDLAALAERLDKVPTKMGDWTGETLETNPVVERAAGGAGMLERRYSSRDGREVSVMLLVGPPGPLSVHLPEICYRGLGFRTKQSIAERELNVSGGVARFRVAEMENANAATPQNLRVYHSWNDGGGWVVPAMPRIAFARSSFLIKLYVTASAAEFLPSGVQDPCEEFIAQCLPEIDRVLLPERSPSEP
jgi:hypothetical protein